MADLGLPRRRGGRKPPSNAMAWDESRLAGEEKRQTKDGQEEPKAFGAESGWERCRYKGTRIPSVPAVSMHSHYSSCGETWGPEGK